MGNCLDEPKYRPEGRPEVQENGGHSGGQPGYSKAHRSVDPKRGDEHRTQGGQFAYQRKGLTEHPNKKPVSASGIQIHITDSSRDDRLLKKENEVKELQDKTDRLYKALEKRDSGLALLRQELQEVKKDRDSILTRNQSLRQENSSFRKQNDELDYYKKKLMYEKDQMQDRLNKALEKRDSGIALLRQELQEVKKDRDNILTRYSALASSKLTDGNANIADLSDENRPTKLAEKYSELYDNEWTEAFCGLTKDGARTEDTACHILAHALCIIYSTCRKEADNDMEALINATKSFYKVDNLPKEMVKAVKDRRKQYPGSNFRELEKVCGAEIDRILPADEQTRVSEYLQKSIELCWLMAVQDPPVFVDTNMSQRDQKFNTAVYKPYTKSGEYVDFIVWPTLFLLEGGSVLCKGIAQGMKSRKGSQLYDNVEIIHITPNIDGKASPVPVSQTVSGFITSTIHTSTIVKPNQADGDYATGSQPIPRVVPSAAPQVTGLKERPIPRVVPSAAPQVTGLKERPIPRLVPSAAPQVTGLKERPIPRVVPSAAPQVTGLKERMNQSGDSKLQEPDKNAPASEQKKQIKSDTKM